MPTSWRSADQRSRSRSARGSRISSAIMSVKALTRSECPRVFRSWRPSEVASARISSATAVGTFWSVLGPSTEPRSSSRVVPARHATFSRLGAWSGKSMVIFSRAASGRRRLHRRSEPTNATADEPSTATHQSACLNRASPRGSSCPTAMAATIDTAKGAATAALDKRVPITRCERQRSVWTISLPRSTGPQECHL